MKLPILPALSCGGNPLELDEFSLGPLRSSSGFVDDVEALHQRMEEDGYLYLPGYLNREEVLAARKSLLDHLMKEGALDPGHPVEEGVVKHGTQFAFRPDLAHQNPDLQRLLYGERMINFYNLFLGGPVRHYDFTWLRALTPDSRGAHPHCDIVYMGRGTRRLFTAWTPLGDIPLEMGGLIILEKSHLNPKVSLKYLERDVNDYCSNGPKAADYQKGNWWEIWDGSISKNAALLRKRLGGRWLTAEFKAGDLLTFGMSTIHAGLDNQSSRLRLSSDSRYQLASEPVDERWVGENPIAHGTAGHRSRIC